MAINCYLSMLVCPFCLDSALYNKFAQNQNKITTFSRTLVEFNYFYVFVFLCIYLHRVFE